jgi:lipopolysaccharide transport system ATP-binding protein
VSRSTGRTGSSGAPICFDGVWKKFRRGEVHDSLRDLIPAFVRSLTTKANVGELGEQEFWALQNVSFEVQPGQALGIIGPNGAGKSTALKLLTRILRPTIGHCEVRGRVGALIEVAAGFHPDLTGRENIYLQGAIMGMKRAEITSKLDEIIEFAGNTAFIDTPVKRYSSGMNARLGFSIAAHLDPEVLIIDEVLSVGDMTFQARCVERMKSYKKRGVAIVFVSHNMQAVADLCENTLHLHSGVRAIGPTAEVMEGYISSMGAGGAALATSDLRIRSAELLDAVGEPAVTAESGDSMILRTTLEGVTDPDLMFGFSVFRTMDRMLLSRAEFPGSTLAIRPSTKGRNVTIDFRFQTHLARGQYFLEFDVWHIGRQELLARLNPAALLTVTEMRPLAGVVALVVDAVRIDGPEPAQRSIAQAG